MLQKVFFKRNCELIPHNFYAGSWLPHKVCFLHNENVTAATEY